MVFNLRKLWTIFSVGFVVLICTEIDKESSKNYFRELDIAKSNEKFNFSIILCYPLKLDNQLPTQTKGLNIQENCETILKTTKNQISSFERQYGKEQNKIIEFFKKCKLNDLVKILKENGTETSELGLHDYDEEDTKSVLKDLNFKIINDRICINYIYPIRLNHEIVKFSIEYEHYQYFDLLVDLRPKNDTNDHAKDKLIYTRNCMQSKSKDNCLNLNEFREYDLSIIRFDTFTNDLEYREECCKDNSRLNETNLNCTQSSIYCNHSYFYNLMIDKFIINNLDKFDSNRLVIQIRKSARQLVKRTKSDNFNPFLLKILYICFLLNINIHSLAKLALNYLLNIESIALLRRFNPFKILKLIIICILIGGLIIKLIIFNLIDSSISQYYNEPLFEDDNVSITICFNYSNILKENLIESCSKNFDNCKLNQIEKATWNEDDFLDKVTLRTSVKVIGMKKDEIIIFYKDKLKCFNYMYNKPNFDQFNALMRSNVLEMNVEDAEIEIFYVQTYGRLPGMHSERHKHFLIYKKKVVKRQEACIKDYTSLPNSTCRYHIDCVERCIFNEYVKNKPNLPARIKLEKSQFNLFLNKSFSSETISDELMQRCEKNYLNDCTQIYLISLHRYNSIDKHRIQINLNPEFESDEKINQKNLKIFIFYLFPFIQLITSFSFTNYFRSMIKYLKNYFKFLIYLIWFIIFYSIMTSTITSILDEPFESAFYHEYADQIELPQIKICWNITLDKDFNSNTGFDLEQMRKKYHNGFTIRSVTYLDSKNYTTKSLVKTPILMNHSSETISSKGIFVSYWLKKYCIWIIIPETYRRTKMNEDRKQNLFDITIDTSKFIDKQVSIFLDSDNYITSDFELIVKQNNHAFISYNERHSVREDDFVYFRKPYLLYDNLMNPKKPKAQSDYIKETTELFTKQQKSTTTYARLSDKNYFNLKIDDESFLDFVHLRTISTNIEDYKLNANYDRELIDFDVTFKYIKENMTKISLIAPDFIISTNFRNNRTSVLNFLIVLLSITAICFDISLINMPSFICFWLRTIKIIIKQFYKILIFIIFKLININSLPDQILTLLNSIKNLNFLRNYFA